MVCLINTRFRWSVASKALLKNIIPHGEELNYIFLNFLCCILLHFLMYYVSGMEEIILFLFYFIFIWKFFYFIRKFFYFRILVNSFILLGNSFILKFLLEENSFILLGNSFILLGNSFIFILFYVTSQWEKILLFY